MRITNNMLINNMLNNIGNNLTRMDKYQNQLSTGKKIQVPSDDPVVAARALKLRTDVSEIEQYQRNIKDAQSWMDITESTLSNIGDVLQRARELAVQGANGTTTPEDTQKIGEEINQLKSQIVHLSNTTYAGRNIFSGYKTDKKLMKEDGNFAIDVFTVNDPLNNISREDIKYEIGVGDNININVLGGDLFNNSRDAISSAPTSGAATGNSDVAPLPLTIDNTNDTLRITVGGVPLNASIPHSAPTYTMATLIPAVQSALDAANGGVSIVTVSNVGDKLRITSNSTGNNSSVTIDETSNAVGNLGLTSSLEKSGTDTKCEWMQNFDEFIAALQVGNHDAIGDVLSKIDSNITNLLRIRADVGARQNRLELTENRLSSDNVNFTKLMSENEDVDMAETIMNLKNEENVYRASLSGGARIIQPTLVDFLR